VAAACAGSGREYLQPILDRLFCSESDRGGHDTDTDDTAGVAKQHTIRCCASPDEVVEKLVRAYQAVAEREIAVGYGLVLVSTQRQTDGTCETKIWSSPLKGHRTGDRCVLLFYVAPPYASIGRFERSIGSTFVEPMVLL
jgi:20S proteasome alpha/beta subunit